MKPSQIKYSLGLMILFSLLISIAQPATAASMATDYNLYRYANNNPVMFVDPSGLESWITYGGGVGITVTFGPSETEQARFFEAWAAAPLGSIARIVIMGHGGGTGIYPQRHKDGVSVTGYNYIRMRSDGKIEIMTRSRNRTRKASLEDWDFQGKADIVELRSCNGGSPDPNSGYILAEQLARVLIGTGVIADEGSPLIPSPNSPKAKNLVIPDGWFRWISPRHFYFPGG